MAAAAAASPDAQHAQLVQDAHEGKYPLKADGEYLCYHKVHACKTKAFNRYSCSTEGCVRKSCMEHGVRCGGFECWDDSLVYCLECFPKPGAKQLIKCDAGPCMAGECSGCRGHRLSRCSMCNLNLCGKHYDTCTAPNYGYTPPRQCGVHASICHACIRRIRDPADPTPDDARVCAGEPGMCHHVRCDNHPRGHDDWGNCLVCSASVHKDCAEGGLCHNCTTAAASVGGSAAESVCQVCAVPVSADCAYGMCDVCMMALTGSPTTTEWTGCMDCGGSVPADDPRGMCGACIMAARTP